jgi:hypothetical protein
MARFPVVCPVCGNREEIAASTVNEVVSLLCCALPSCPTCGWAREEDAESPLWGSFAKVYNAHIQGEDIKQAWLDELSRHP